jgi:hypothetical protein
MSAQHLAIVGFAIIISLIGVLFSLWQRDEKKYGEFDLTDLLMENGKMSRLAFTWLGSFLVMSFGFIYLLLTKGLTDTYALLYAGTWAVPIITKMFAVKPDLPMKSGKEVPSDAQP